MTSTESKPAPAATRPADDRPAVTRLLQTIHFGPVWGVLIALALLVAYLGATQHAFLTWHNFTNIVSSNSTMLLMAVGATFVIVGGGIDLSAAGVVTTVGMIFALLLGRGMNVVLALLIMIAAALGIGAINVFLITRMKISFLVVTLGAGTVWTSVARGSYGFDVMADDLGNVLAKLDIKDATLVGSSMGCSVILEYMQRSASRVARVVLNNGPIMLVKRDDFPWAMPQEQLDGYVNDIEARWPLSEWGGLGGESEESHPAEKMSHYLTALQTPLDIALAVVRQQAKLDHRDAVRGLQVPVLAAYSVKDPFYPPDLAKWIASTAPRGSFELFYESGHATRRDEPEKFARVIREFADDSQGGAVDVPVR